MIIRQVIQLLFRIENVAEFVENFLFILVKDGPALFSIFRDNFRTFLYILLYLNNILNRIGNLKVLSLICSLIVHLLHELKLLLRIRTEAHLPELG